MQKTLVGHSAAKIVVIKRGSWRLCKRLFLDNTSHSSSLLCKGYRCCKTLL